MSQSPDRDRLGPAPTVEPPEGSPAQVEPTLGGIRRQLLADAEAHVKAVKDFMAADGNLYAIDMFLVGVANRSMYLTLAFIGLVDAWNVFAAAPLIRLQVDSLLRVSYLFRDSTAPDDLAAEILKGTRFRDLKDSFGRRLTDARLLELATPHHEWLGDMYAAGNSWIHLSTVHVLSPWELVEEKDVLKAGQIGRMETWFPIRRAKVPPEFLADMFAAMAEATSELLVYLEIWRRRKGMPPGKMRA